MTDFIAQHVKPLNVVELGLIDSVYTIVEDPRPDRGSIVLYAGWMENDEFKGGAPSGYMPVPKQFLQVAVSDPLALTIIRSKAQSPAPKSN